LRTISLSRLTVFCFFIDKRPIYNRPITSQELMEAGYKRTTKIVYVLAVSSFKCGSTSDTISTSLPFNLLINVYRRRGIRSGDVRCRKVTSKIPSHKIPRNRYEYLGIL